MSVVVLPSSEGHHGDDEEDDYDEEDDTEKKNVVIDVRHESSDVEIRNSLPSIPRTAVDTIYEAEEDEMEKKTYFHERWRER